MRWLGEPGRVAVVIAVAAWSGACGYERPDDVLGDAAFPDDQPPAYCVGDGIFVVCLADAPTGSLVLGQTIDTDTSSSCAAGSSGVDACVIAATTVSVAADTDVRAVGSRPLVVVAAQDLVIEGTLSVGSSRAPVLLGAGASAAAAFCGIPLSPADETEGAGGGAGGSFTGRGGDGGDGRNTGSRGLAGPSGSPTQVRAGCAGDTGGSGADPIDGVGGAGGGALYLIAAGQLRVLGAVSASGAGGSPGRRGGGGGGGGSGGMIRLDAPMVIVSGALAANGGGGGEGAGSEATTAGAGADGTLGVNGALGGRGGTDGGGDGGDGSAGPAPGAAGRKGGNNPGGGGGGGGGAGYIYIKTAASDLSGIISPAPDLQ